MGLMNSALQIGRTALLSYQGALQTIGNNISSAGSPDYTRLSPQLDPLPGQPITGNVQPGAGVALTGIQRHIDSALEARLRVAIGASESSTVRRDALTAVEGFLNDIDGTTVNARMRDFFSAFDNLQNTPEDLATRDLAITAGQQLASELRTLRGQFGALGADLDDQIADLVATADEIAQKIGRLNSEIARAEAGSNGQATGLRDQRDALLRELAQLFDVTVHEQPDGAINVYIGSEALVQASFVRGLTTVEELDGAFTRTAVRFADSGGQVDVRGGRIEGLMVSRETEGYGRVGAVDELAAAMIAEVNRIHADGQGLLGFDSVTGAYEVLATDAPLNAAAAGLAFPPRDGSFYLVVSDDATGTPVAYRIDVSVSEPGSETTLDSLVADINAQVEGVTAEIAAGSRLRLTATDGHTFTFGHDGQEAHGDTSGVLAALGVNNFFTGMDAHDIAVSPVLLSEPRLLAAAATLHPGDGTNAGRMASLEVTASQMLGGTTIRDFYNGLLRNVAVASAAAHDDAEAKDSILASLTVQKETVSGVNLDEEAVSLLKFERAFQGVARYVSVVDGLIGELVSLIR